MIGSKIVLYWVQVLIGKLKVMICFAYSNPLKNIEKQLKEILKEIKNFKMKIKEELRDVQGALVDTNKKVGPLNDKVN